MELFNLLLKSARLLGTAGRTFLALWKQGQTRPALGTTKSDALCGQSLALLLGPIERSDGTIGRRREETNQCLQDEADAPRWLP